MPTVILLDVSLSMSCPVDSSDASLTKKQLAVKGINAFLDHLSVNLKLEFVSLVIFSSLWEQVVGFTRDYSQIKQALETVDAYNKTYIESALRGAAALCIDEWTSVAACQIILVTDGNSGTGESSLKASLLKQATAGRASSTVAQDDKFPLPFKFPCKLHVMCMAPSADKTLIRSLPHYQKLVELNQNRGEVFVPEGSSLTTTSVEDTFKSMCNKFYTIFTGTLKCGHMSCAVQVFPAIDAYDSDHDFEHVTRESNHDLQICGFLHISDLASPAHLSRHLLLPVSDGNKSTDSDDDDVNTSAFTVLLHGSLKVEGMVALVQVADDWFGMLYSWADNKKKANLMLSLFTPGADCVSWLGDIQQLMTSGEFEDNPYGESDRVTPFPVRSAERRSYTQNCVVWIKQTGLQADIQKILRNAKKIPDKQVHFYKELNKLRRAALSFGFHSLLDAVAQLLEREVQFLPGNAHPDAAIQLSHAAAAMRSHSALDADDNIAPLRTNYAT